MKKKILFLIVGTLAFVSSCKKDEPGPQNNNNGTNNLTVQQELDSGKTPMQLFTEGKSLSEIYCNTYAGGIIFYLDTLTGQGLVCTTTDIGTNVSWDPTGTFLPANTFVYLGCTDTSLWSGQQNTSNVAAIKPTSACGLAENLTHSGYSDWFLPSKAEARLMFNVLGVNGCNLLTQSGPIYWTSSEIDQSQAWRIINYSGYGLDEYNKDYAGVIRPVRIFN